MCEDICMQNWLCQNITGKLHPCYQLYLGKDLSCAVLLCSTDKHQSNVRVTNLFTSQWQTSRFILGSVLKPLHLLHLNHAVYGWTAVYCQATCRFTIPARMAYPFFFLLLNHCHGYVKPYSDLVPPPTWASWAEQAAESLPFKCKDVKAGRWEPFCRRIQLCSVLWPKHVTELFI